MKNRNINRIPKISGVKNHFFIFLSCILSVPGLRTIRLLKPILLCACLLIYGMGYSQDSPSNSGPEAKPKIHRFQLGLKVGTPGIVSLGAEFVTPVLENRLAPFIEYSNIGVDQIEGTEIEHKYLEYGVNLYFSEKGRGGYLSISRSNLGLNASAQEPDYSAHGDLSFESTNVKLGGRFGKRVYFRIEAGYSFGKVPEGIEYLEYGEDGFAESEFEEFPEEFTALTRMGLPVFNIGLGLSF